MQESAERPEWFDMQGLLLSAYPRLTQARYQLFRITEGQNAAARLWLNRLRHDITPGLKHERSLRPRNFNIAMSATGLAKLVDVGTPFEPSIDDVAAVLPHFSSRSSKASPETSINRGFSATLTRTALKGGRGDRPPCLSISF